MNKTRGEEGRKEYGKVLRVKKKQRSKSKYED